MIPWGLAIALSVAWTALALGAVYVFVHRPLLNKLQRAVTRDFEVTSLAQRQSALLAWMAQVLRIEPSASAEVFKNALKALQRKKTRSA